MTDSHRWLSVQMDGWTRRERLHSALEAAVLFLIFPLEVFMAIFPAFMLIPLLGPLPGFATSLAMAFVGTFLFAYWIDEASPQAQGYRSRVLMGCDA